MNGDHTNVATMKILLAWFGAMFGGITLSNTALVMTIVFTGLQIYKLARDLWFPPKAKP